MADTVKRPDQVFAGVYGIRCRENGRIYIGSSVDVHSRLFDSAGHRALLRNGKHHNRHLQADFRRYGVDAFEVRVIDVNDSLKSARKSEQDWIDVHRDCPEALYNIARSVEFYDGSDRRKTVQLVSPTGEAVTITGIKQFCREQGLDYAAISRVIKSPRLSYKGWRRPDHVSRVNTLFLISPHGENVTIEDDAVGEFCVRNRISRETLNNLRAGRRTSTKCGWHYDQSKIVSNPISTTLSWRDADGAPVTIPRSELDGYCQAHGYCKQLLLALSAGRQHRYKGLWEMSATPEEIAAGKARPKVVKPPRGDLIKKTYTFRSPSGEEVTFRGLTAFCATHGLPRSSISLMTTVPGYVCRGWTFVRSHGRLP